MGKWVTSKIYPINYLKNSELTDEDLRNLIDKSSLILSLVLYEFRMIGDKREDWVILKEVKTEEKPVSDYKKIDFKALNDSIDSEYASIFGTGLDDDDHKKSEPAVPSKEEVTEEEPSKDEVKDEPVSNDLNIFELFSFLKEEGHTFIWFLLLMPFAKTNFMYLYSLVSSKLLP